MNAAVIHSLFVGVPLGVVAILSALIYSRQGNHPATYTLSEPWTYGPILWAAVEEVVPGGQHGHGASEFSAGGGASGKW